MRFKPVVILLVLLVTFLLPCYAQIDFGATVDNATGLSTDGSPEFSQMDKLSLWFDAALGEWMSLAVQGSYTFSLERYYLFDVDFLEFEGKFPIEMGASIFNFAAGRFAFLDFTQNVLDHRLDGVLLGLQLPFMRITAACGFSGLLFNPTSSIIMSKADSTRSQNDNQLLASPRLIEIADVIFPELLLRQNLHLSIVLQQDLNPAADLAAAGETTLTTANGGRLSTQYWGAGISGAIAPSLYYDAFFYLGTGSVLSYISGTYRYTPIIAFLTGGGVRLYIEEALGSIIELKTIYSAGDADSTTTFREGNTVGDATTFVPISRPNLALVFSPQLGNLFFVELSYSLKPFSWAEAKVFDTLQNVFKGIVFFRPTTGLISESGINSSSASPYLGTEVDWIINFRPLSDLGFALSLGLFIPDNVSSASAFTDSRKLEFLGRFELSLSF